jgi:hypothetical protein
MISRVSVYAGNLPISCISRLTHTHVSSYTRAIASLERLATSHIVRLTSRGNVTTILKSIEVRFSEELQLDKNQTVPEVLPEALLTRLGLRGRDEIYNKSLRKSYTWSRARLRGDTYLVLC